MRRPNESASSSAAAASCSVAPARCNYLVVSFTTDWRFSPERSRELVDGLIAAGKPVSYAEIDAPQGHDAFLIPIPRYMEVFGGYMNRIEVSQ